MSRTKFTFKHLLDDTVSYIKLVHKCNTLELDNAMLRKELKQKIYKEITIAIQLKTEIESLKNLLIKKDQKIEYLKNEIKEMNINEK